ncbi:MAG: hypothetical protein Q8L59_11225 [Phenylobacterium sp.]|uniref:hypothetical protein n=1 Tax=Phenylobacterium sp. TaxID=1871053 RepID=UPI002735A628|nr:hypothetical protein [Phenylobacterium sp.]MDP1642746.1 hypothetical protein [Phenylobacterium sp.]MDP3117206.1 hypothetical protein [Phenylobacterium sp.]
MSRTLVLGGLAALGLAGVAVAQSPEPAACVALDDRPCYASPTVATERGARRAGAAPNEAAGYSKARELAASGKCYRALDAAQATQDPALVAEIRRACSLPPVGDPKDGAVKLW